MRKKSQGLDSQKGPNNARKFPTIRIKLRSTRNWTEVSESDKVMNILARIFLYLYTHTPTHTHRHRVSLIFSHFPPFCCHNCFEKICFSWHGNSNILLDHSLIHSPRLFAEIKTGQRKEKCEKHGKIKRKTIFSRLYCCSDQISFFTTNRLLFAILLENLWNSIYNLKKS